MGTKAKDLESPLKFQLLGRLRLEDRKFKAASELGAPVKNSYPKFYMGPRVIALRDVTGHEQVPHT